MVGFLLLNVRTCVLHHREARISWELFELESPNFTGKSIPTNSTATPDITSTPASGQKILPQQTSKVLPPMASGGISRECSMRGLRNFTGISWTIGYTNMSDMMSLAVSGQLQNAIKYFKYCQKIALNGSCRPKSWKIRPLVNLESPNFGQTATLDKTSPDTFGGIHQSSKNGRKCRIRQLWVKFIQNDSSENHAILHTYRGQSARQTC